MGLLIEILATMSFQINLLCAKPCTARVFHRVSLNRFHCTDSSSPESVVITGVSCRLPSCASFTEFGCKLRDGHDMMEEQTRLKSFRVPKRLGLLQDLSKFDASFFKMPPRLADASDPQLRMLLEVVFETIIDAGINPETLRGEKVGVYVAASGGDTIDYTCLTVTESQLDGFKLLGLAGFMMANQISYHFDFKGTSLLISSGCSSSMVALETAVSAIREGRINSAIVAASRVYLSSLSSIEFAALGATSADGICRAFDDSANGFVRSEAIISILLQRKAEARRCRAIIRAVSTNNDGYKPEGIPYPSSCAQTKLLQEIYGMQIDPNEVSYLEAHGTGTPTGDPEELEAISEIFVRRQSQNHARTSPLLIGSVKTNLGHTEMAAGLCGIAKVLTMFQSGVIPPTLNYITPNLKCRELVHGSLKVVSKPMPFSGGLVGVSSLSIGGVNGHVVLEPCLWKRNDNGVPSVTRSRSIMLLSGRSKSDMKSAIESNIEQLQNPEFRTLVHSTFGASTILGHNYRAYGIFSLDEEHECKAPSKVYITQVPSARRPLWFIFNGLGLEVRGLEEELLQSANPFRSSLHTSCDILMGIVGMDLRQYLASDVALPNADAAVGLVALTAIQIAFVDTLKSIGVEPDGMIGYSAGELACAYVDGCLTREEALLLSFYIGKSYIEADALDGAMASIGLSWDEAARRCPPDVHLACRNAEGNVTVAGKLEAVNEFLEQLKSEGIPALKIHTYGIAPHQGQPNERLFRCMYNLFESVLKGSHVARSDRWISSSASQLKRTDNKNAKSCSRYFVSNVKNPVLLYDALDRVPEEAILLEIGPSSLLKPFLARSVGKDDVLSVSNSCGTDRVTTFLQSIGRLYTLGVNMNVSCLLPGGESTHGVSSQCPDLAQLVTWDHRHSWNTYVIPYPKELASTIRVDVRDPQWSFIRGHRIGNCVLFPATGYLYLAWRMFADKHGLDISSFPVEFRRVSLRRTTVISETCPVDFQFSVLGGSGQFEIRERRELVAEGQIRAVGELPAGAGSHQALQDSEPACSSLTNDEFYKELRMRGYAFSKLFRSVVQVACEGIAHILAGLVNRKNLEPILIPMQASNNLNSSSLSSPFENPGSNFGSVQTDSYRIFWIRPIV